VFLILVSCKLEALVGTMSGDTVIMYSLSERHRNGHVSKYSVAKRVAKVISIYDA
jgi:hypothetical protein